MAGGFGLPLDVDRSFDRLVQGLVLVFAQWIRPDQTKGQG
jgi:hypothetical protein